MGLLIATKKKKSPLQKHAKDGDETLGANEIYTDQEDTQLGFLSGRVERPRNRVEERPQKRRKLEEVAVLETLDQRVKMRVRQPLPIKLRTANVRARTKMKARRVILVDGSSTESSVAASQGRFTSAEWEELEADVTRTEEEGPSERDLRSSEWRSSSALEGDAPKGRMKMAAKAVTAKQVESLTANPVAAKASLEVKEKQLQESESKCVAFQRRLAEETKLRKSSEKACESLQTNVEITRRAIVDLWDEHEASRVAFNEEAHRVDELMADLAKRDQTHAMDLAAKAKELAECEAA
ncbi:hypothetical protein AXG93_4548s1160 [Marchantia polymorpha subsp. ruderalis]|uniref:Uncharacterized protein n=1 Tax=Marchantia polymorpha subsp. ruderalis TaxID=1480154 RepID=A0A176W8U4_MARPO|nr:hypothetical protein AXG93_4548s1160 [Marchantia polymorpha subsp. ruderalis]